MAQLGRRQDLVREHWQPGFSWFTGPRGANARGPHFENIMSPCSCLVSFETRSHFVAQAGLKLIL